MFAFVCMDSCIDVCICLYWLCLVNLFLCNLVLTREMAIVMYQLVCFHIRVDNNISRVFASIINLIRHFLCQICCVSDRKALGL